jgi:stearoyl-CoA desaturase (delta-9 desaturase)
MPGFGELASRWWIPIVFVIVAGHITNVCVTLFLHRAQTHRGVRLHYLAALPMRVWLWMTTAIVTKEWVACHRKHHAFADREGDPHSPLLEGLRNILLKGAFYYRRAVRQPGLLEKYGKGTPNDWLERHLLSRLNWLGIILMLGIGTSRQSRSGSAVRSCTTITTPIPNRPASPLVGSSSTSAGSISAYCSW